MKKVYVVISEKGTFVFADAADAAAFPGGMQRTGSTRALKDALVEYGWAFWSNAAYKIAFPNI